MSLHNFEKMYETSIKNVNNSHISARNKEIILSFGNDLLLENLSKARILKYYYALTMFARNLNKDFDKADINDIKILVANIQQNSKYSPWTKKTYKMMIRRFYKLLKGVKGKNKYPEIVDWIPTKIKRSEQRLPSSEDMLNEEDVNKMISKAYHPRDKAFLSVLWESGARIGEIGNLLFKNVVFDDYGTVIVVQGKTGSRKIRLISSTPYLSTWMDSHPLKLQKEPGMLEKL